jgi:hypothetical protein
MRRNNRWIVVVPVMAGLQLSACHRGVDKPTKIKPAHVEHIDGTELSRVILTAKAAERLGIKTAPVGEVQATRSAGGGGSVREVQLAQAGARRKVVPYAAVLYDAHGDTWVYTSPAPLVFVRHGITVEYIAGDQAVLAQGPPIGTAVVTVGAAELFGAEFEIGH